MKKFIRLTFQMDPIKENWRDDVMQIEEPNPYLLLRDIKEREFVLFN